MTLPLFIHKNNRWTMAVLCGIAFFFGYSIPNHYHLLPPQQLALTEWDKAVPFMPWTIIAYMSEYFLFVIAYWVFDDELNRNRYVWAYFGMLLVGAVFFVGFPTTYPRSDYPLPSDLNLLIYNLFALLRTLDDPSNCFPSMHVTCCYLTAFAFLPASESRKKFILFFIWATIVALSTLPTKQHYIADVIGGFCLSVVGYWLFFKSKKIKYVSMTEFVQRVRAYSWSSES